MKALHLFQFVMTMTHLDDPLSRFPSVSFADSVGNSSISTATDNERQLFIEQSGAVGNFGHGFTYGGHPMGCAVGSAAIDIYKRRDILGHVRKISPIFAAHLKRLGEHPLVGESRSLGLMGALELAPDKSGRTAFNPIGKVGAKAAAEMAARGVIVRAIGDSMAFCPPMIMTEAEMEEMFAPVEASLDAAHAWAKSEGLL